MRQHTSRRSVCSAAFLTVGIIVAAALWNGSSPGQSALASGGPGTLGLGQGIAGTWVWFIDGAQQHINIRADGTLDWYGSWFFGAGTGTFLDAPVYGTWRRSGPREITTIEIGMLFDGEGVFEATGRVVQIITFSHDLQSASIYGVEEILLPDQDPSDPDAVPVDVFDFEYDISRVNHLD
jgi:hypothetical protein